MRNLLPLYVVLASLSLSGCFGDGDEPSPPKETGSTKIEETIFGGEIPDVSTAFRALWDPGASVLPYPNDLRAFPDSTDGSMALSEDVSGVQALVPQLNQLDGFSTNARITQVFSDVVDASSLTPASVFLIEVAVTPGLRAVVGLADDAQIRFATTGNPFLVQGVDYDVSLVPDFDDGGVTIQLKPLKPLNEGNVQTLEGNEGLLNAYMVILMGGENGIRSTDGTPAVADTTYEQIKQAYLAGLIQLPDDPSQVPPDLPEDQLIGLFTAAQIAVAEFLLTPLGLDAADIISTSSFSTLNATDVMEVVSQTTQPQDSQLERAVTPVPLPLPDGTVLPPGTPVTTALVLGAIGLDPALLPGEGDVYDGTMTVPYYLEPAEDPSDDVILSTYWVAEAGGNPFDPESTVLSRFNPVPVKRADVQVPVLITIPNENTDYAAQVGGAVPPPEGWPVVIYYHGVTRSRSDLFLMTEPLNNLGFAVIAIDQPLHGIAVAELDLTLPPEEIAAIIAENPTVLLRVPGVTERTFDVDLITGATPGTPPDGEIDPSGAHTINLISPISSRDNLRQASADLITLTRTLPTMDIDNDGEPDFDGSRIHFIGQSLGSMVAAAYLAVDPTAASASLAEGGAVITDLLLDSFEFGPIIEAGLSTRLVPNTGTYNNYVRDVQHLIDAGDPVMFAARAAELHPIHFFYVEDDQIIPNSAQARYGDALGVTDVTTPGPNPEPGGWVARVCFTEGSHGSYFNPLDSIETYTEMQTQALVFAGGFPPQNLPGNGQIVLISDPTVVGDFAAGDCQAPDRPRANTQ